jgi:hypothetical protein
MGLFDSTIGEDRRGRVLAEVAEERVRQDEKWGGADHDDAHNLYDWCEFVADRVGRIRPGDVTLEGIQHARRRLVQTAALAVAAVESLDRNLARLAQERAHAGG